MTLHLEGHKIPRERAPTVVPHIQGENPPLPNSNPVGFPAD